MFAPFKTNSSDVRSLIALADTFLGEGISALGLSGETDGGAPGPGGGGPPMEVDQQVPEIPRPGSRIRINKPGHVSHGQKGVFDQYHEHLVKYGLPCEVHLDRDRFSDHDYSDGESFWETHEVELDEADVLAYSGSGPTTFVDANAPLPWNGGGRGVRRKRRIKESDYSDLIQHASQSASYRGHVLGSWTHSGRSATASCHVCGSSVTVTPKPQPNEIDVAGTAVAAHCHAPESDKLLAHSLGVKWESRLREHEGFLLGHPTDATQTGSIQITVLDSTNLRVLAPGRILEMIEAYKLFEQFQYLLPRTPMLNIVAMESIASWWRSFAVEGDLLEIDCTNGFATVTNGITNNFYGLGCLGGGAPTTLNA